MVQEDGARRSFAVFLLVLCSEFWFYVPPLSGQRSSGGGCMARSFVTAEALGQRVPMGLLKVVEAGIPLWF